MPQDIYKRVANTLATENMRKLFLPKVYAESYSNDKYASKHKRAKNEANDRKINRYASEHKALLSMETPTRM